MNKTNPLSAILYCILVLLTELSFTELFAGTFLISYHVIAFIGFSAVTITCLAVLNALRKKVFAIVGLLVVAGLAAGMVYLDLYEIRTAALKVYDLLRYKFTGSFPYVDKVRHNQLSLALMFSIIGILPSFAALWAFLKRKTSLPAIFLFLFYFVPAALHNNGSCATIWYVLCGFEIMMLVVFDGVRVAAVKNADVTMFVAGIPYLAVCLVLALLFPMESYTKDKDAFELYNKTIVKIDKALGTNFKRKIAQMRGEYTSFDEVTDKIASKLGADVTTTDLTAEGLKAPRQEIIVANITLELNEDVDVGDIGDIYIKNCAMSTFDGSSWTRNDEVPDFTNESSRFNTDEYPYAGVMAISHSAVTSAFIAPVPNIQNSTIICSYSAFEGMPGLPAEAYPESDSDFVGYTKLNYSYPESLTANEIYTFQDYEYSVYYQIRCSDYPAMPVPEWSEEYLDYVSEECTFVPDSTRSSILEKDVLPDWYMAVLNGEKEMSDADKVASVMNYVYSVKPYNLKTDFAPENEDFVAWFLSEGKSGYCVHFASSAAVLLRMIGVPTRYVSGYYVGSASSFSNPISYVVVDDVLEEITDYYYVKSITEEDAHAWVEYFDPEYGWVGFDPTSNRFISGYRPYTPGNITVDEKKPAVPTEAVPNETVPEEVTATPTPVAEPAFEASNLLGNKPFLVSAAFVLMLVFARLVYVIYWKYKFSSGNSNSRIRAYRRYANLMAGKKESIPVKMNYLTNVAMFSKEGASSEDVDTMRKLTQEYVKESTSSKSLPGRILDKLILSVPL